MAGNWSWLGIGRRPVTLPLQDSCDSGCEPESDPETESEVTDMLDSSDTVLLGLICLFHCHGKSDHKSTSEINSLPSN